MQSVISRVLLPTLRILPPPPPASIIIQRPGFPVQVPQLSPALRHRTSQMGAMLLQGHLGDDSRCAPLGKDRPLRQLRNGAQVGGEGESTKHRAASRSSVQRSSPARGTGAAKSTGFQRVTRPSSQNPGGGAAPAESGRSGPWPLGLSPERTSS